jgi:hypothetical protein
MIDVFAEHLMSRFQHWLAMAFPCLWAILAGCLGLGAWATILALFSPSFPPAWILTAVFLSAASAGYTLAQRRPGQIGLLFWAAALACGAVVAGAAWKLLLYAQAATHLSVLSQVLILGLFACSLGGVLAGTWLRLRYEQISPAQEHLPGKTKRG